MVKLYILGSAELRNADGNLEQSFLSGPKRLALLVYLKLHRPGKFLRRDSLLPLFWPEHNQKSARNTLSNMLYHMRQALGGDIIMNRGKEEIELGEIWCDVNEFEKAVKNRNTKKGLELYRGHLLEGLHVPNVSAQFEQWLDLERERLRRKYWDLIKIRAQEAENRGDANAAAKWWHKLSREDPYNSKAIRRLMKALVAGDKHHKAIGVARNHANLLEKEFGADAKKEVQKLTKNIEEEAAEVFTDRITFSRNTSLNSHFVAILPFVNLNNNEETYPFATGLHNDLLSRLSNISALKVIARTSVMRYQNQEHTISEIAKELGVGTIVEGSVQNTSKRVRLNIQLTDAGKEQLLWAETYDRKLTKDNLFDIQSELAEKIMSTLQAKLTDQEKKRIENKPTENIEAYHLYVQGRTHLAKRIEPSIYRALNYFQQAIEQDENYALAWAGLAESLALLKFYKYPVPKEAPDDIKAAQRALELNPQLGEGHASLGILHSTYKNGPKAIQELEKAVELQSNYAEAYIWLGWMYMILGETEKALMPAEKAVELDPLAPYVRIYLAKIYLAGGHFKKALHEAKSGRQTNPDFALAHFMEGLVLYHMGRFSEALFSLNEALSAVSSNGVPPETEVKAVLALTYISTGNTSKAKQILAQIQKTKDLFSTGLIHAALGSSEDAIRNFERIKSWNYFTTAYVRYFFPKVLKPLRNDSRYKQILQDVSENWGLKK